MTLYKKEFYSNHAIHIKVTRCMLNSTNLIFISIFQIPRIIRFFIFRCILFRFPNHHVDERVFNESSEYKYHTHWHPYVYSFRVTDLKPKNIKKLPKICWKIMKTSLKSWQSNLFTAPEIRFSSWQDLNWFCLSLEKCIHQFSIRNL